MTESVALSDIIRPAGRRANADIDLPVYSVTKHRGFVPSLEYFNKQVFAKDLSSYKVVSAGEFAYATIHLDEGSIGVAPETALISPMYTVFEADQSKAETDFLIRFLKSPIAISQYERLGRGTAERRKSISLEALGRVRVPLPPLPEQRRIAAILDQADELRMACRNKLRLLDSLEDASFQVLIEESLDLRAARSAPLSSLAEFYGGNSLPAGEDFQNQSGGYLLLKVSDLNLRGNERVVRTAQLWSADPGSKASTAPAGSIVLPKRGGAISTNKKRVLARSAVLDPNLMAIAPGPELEIAYLEAWFRRFDLRTLVSGSSVPQLNKQDLAPLMVSVPPRRLQRTFGVCAERVEEIRASISDFVALTDELFESLQFEHFSM